MTLKWNELECFKTNGAISGYEIHIFNLSCLKKTVIVSGAMTTTYTYNDLTFDRYKHSFSIAAINEAGIGKHSRRIYSVPVENGKYFEMKLMH